MKKLTSILWSLLTVITLAACGKDPKPDTEGKGIFNVQEGKVDMSFVYREDVCELKFTTDSDWKFNCSADWISSSKLSGTKGTVIISFKAKENESTTARDATGAIRCGSVDHQLTFHQDGRPEGEKRYTLRVMQFNILQSTSETAGHEWTAVRKAPCFAMLKDTQPDIICYQEARKTQCNDLATAFGTNYESILFPKDSTETNGGQRNLIMFRKDAFTHTNVDGFAHGYWDKFWFSTTGGASGDRFGDTKTTQKMELFTRLVHKESGKVIWVFNAHFFASCDYAESRSKCVEMTIAAIKKYVKEDEIVFFTGDLNINYNDASMRPLLDPLLNYMNSAALKAKTSDGQTTETYNKFTVNYNKVLDYIFYRNAIPLTYKVVNSDQYGTTYVSDHFPIYSDMEF